MYYIGREGESYEMKEIIYLNTDLIHSFMAQTFRGLPVTTTNEQFQQDEHTKTDSMLKKGQHEVHAEMNSGKINLPFLPVSPNGTLSYDYNNGKEFNESIALTQVDAGKEIISKQLHDNALNEYINYMEENNLLSNVETLQNGKHYVGDYIKIKSPFNIFDIEYVSKVIDTKMMTDFLDLGTKIQAQNQKGNAKNNAKNPALLTPAVKNGMSLFNLIMNYLAGVLPTNQFIRIDGCIAPLKKEHLRESSFELNFKYGMNSKIEITIIGRVTKVFESFNDNYIKQGEFKEVMDSTTEAIELMIQNIDFIQKGDLILSPVAIYFE